MPSNIRRVNQRVELVEWDRVLLGSREIARWIADTLGNNTSIYGIPRGGVIPAVAIVHQLEAYGLSSGFTVRLDDLMQRAQPKLVVVDEICDSGDTLKMIKDLFPAAHTATLMRRHSADFAPDFNAFDISDDRWMAFPWELK